MTGSERDLPGAGQLVTSALVTESLVWTLKLTVDAKRPSGGGGGFRLSTLLHCAYAAALCRDGFGAQLVVIY
jgi:hypothetical protein